MIQLIYKDCIEILKDLAGNETLYFDDAIEIKTSPHTPAIKIWALCVSPKDELFLMDANEEWNKLLLTDINASYVAGSVYQRLNFIRRRYAKAS
jgi:hypothetical protein